MSDFWSNAFSDLGANFSLVTTVVEDLNENLNPFGDHFLSGDAPATAAEAERQNAERQGREVDPRRIAATTEGGLGLVVDAGELTGDQVKHAVGEALAEGAKDAGRLLDLLTNKWFLGVVAGVVVLVLAAPYVGPALARAR